MDIAVPVSRLLYLSTFFLGVSSVFWWCSAKSETLYTLFNRSAYLQCGELLRAQWWPAFADWERDVGLDGASFSARSYVFQLMGSIHSDGGHISGLV